jgi:hypothetical protein
MIGDLRCPSKFVISFSFFCRLVLKGIGVAWKRIFLASAEGSNTRGRDGVSEHVESQCKAGLARQSPRSKMARYHWRETLQRRSWLVAILRLR